jgi:DNA replication protein DnaC
MALELVKSLGLFSHGIVIVYGASGVGKTTLTLAVMREL